MKIMILRLFYLLCISCISEKEIQRFCQFNGDGLSTEAYQKELKDYLNCLVKENLEGNDKKDFLEILGNGINGKWINSPKKYATSYIAYQSLLQIVDKEELISMMDSNIPALRYYGFLGIAERYQEATFLMLKKMINDTESVYGAFGCVVGEKTVADYCIEQVIKTYRFDEPNYKSEIYQLSSMEKEELDDLILNSNLKIAYRDELINAQKQ